MKSIVALAVVALAAGLTGCTEPYFESLSAPPPTKTADLDSADKTIEISAGVALAFECSLNNAPCQAAKASVGDEAIATVARAYLDYLSDAIYDPSVSASRGKTARTAFVVVGRAPGKTKLTVKLDDDGDETEVDLDVTVRP